MEKKKIEAAGRTFVKEAAKSFEKTEVGGDADGDDAAAACHLLKKRAHMDAMLAVEAVASTAREAVRVAKDEPTDTLQGIVAQATLLLAATQAATNEVPRLVACMEHASVSHPS